MTDPNPQYDLNSHGFSARPSQNGGWIITKGMERDSLARADQFAFSSTADMMVFLREMLVGADT